MLLTDYRFHEVHPLADKSSDANPLTVRRLGLQAYLPIWHAMRYIADHPERERGDELWLLSHKPVYTLGQAGRQEHVLNAGGIPLVQTDRGGQVTYHGPGQLVVYLLLDLKRRGLGVRGLVDLIEQSIIDTLFDFGVSGNTRRAAPGVYVDDAKIAALGLRIRKGRSYHGLSLNVDMDLTPFESIDPCGFAGLKVTQLADLVENRERLLQRTAQRLVNHMLERLGFQHMATDREQAGIV